MSAWRASRAAPKRSIEWSSGMGVASTRRRLPRRSEPTSKSTPQFSVAALPSARAAVVAAISDIRRAI
jgi:hypothetical protein